MLKTILTPKLYLPIVYIVGAIVVYKIIIHLLNKTLFKRKGKKKTTFQMNKEATIINLIKSIIKYLIAIIVVLAILNLYGVQTGAIIASLGIVGAVLGLAFQDTIKNLLSGITIIFDDHYVQGDIITINGFRGEVIELGLQTTKVKGYNGEVLIIQNSAITSVINHSMYDTMYYLSFSVSNNVSLKQLETILNNINKKLIKMNEVKNDMQLLGVEELCGNHYIYKVLIDCKSDNHYAVNRAFMKYLKEEYEQNNIKVPGEYLEVKVGNK